MALLHGDESPLAEMGSLGLTTVTVTVTVSTRDVSSGQPTYATAASPFFSTSDSSLSEAPDGRFSPRSHLLTRLLVTFR